MNAAFRNDIFNDIGKALDHLHNLWNDCGFNEASQAERRNSVKQHLLDMLEAMVEEEEENKIKIVVSIENLLKEAAQLNSELGVTIPVDACEYESLPLCEVEADLKARVEDCRVIKQQRLSRYKDLLNEEHGICQSLDIECRQCLSNAVPTDQQLSEFQMYLETKSIELENLKKSFIETRTKVINIMKELEMIPLLDFEKYVVSCDEETFQFSKKNIANMKELHHSLEQKLEDTRALAIELRESLSKLWDRLYESYEVRSAFLAAHSGCSASTIDALKKEIQRCEERKRQNIKVFIDKIREEIQDLWMKCSFGETQKSKFLPFNSNCYTEDLLELHELELERLKHFYDCNKIIYELMEKRQRLWMKMEDLENRTHDQNRLFDNRGGQLLREAKERKMIEKDLPKIEARLKLLVREFENDSGEPFLFHDRNLSALIDEQWSEFKGNKEREKLNRKMRGAETDVKLTRSKLLTLTPSGSANKVRHLASESSSKMLRLNEKSSLKAKKSLFQKESALSQRNCFRKPANMRPLNATKAVDSSIASTTYADFEAHLDSVCRNNNRSTRFGSQVAARVLKERNDNEIRTPVRRLPLKAATAITPSRTQTLLLRSSTKINRPQFPSTLRGKLPLHK